MSEHLFVIDGTNVVLLHGRGSPELRYLLALCEALRRRGYSFVCFFDANTGYILEANAGEQAEVFQQVLVDPRWSASLQLVPGGIEADEWILEHAKAEDADVISNDKYRDRARRHRWIWKRRDALVGERDRLILESLGLEIPVLPLASDYL
jgi:hypothetical protein